MSNNRIYIIKEHVGSFEHGELDYELSNRFGFEYEDGSSFIELEKGHGSVDNTPIDINTLLETITELKSRGATHVSIDYHCDHIAYELSGYYIQQADPSLVEAYEETSRIEEARRNKIDLLKKELAELENQKYGNSLISDPDDLPF
jgi:hypothetical protein